ncbi:MAG TPA: tRNA (adenosine(37)-N6)-threonylcarbamoyltransferase complex dimerization subunit type 1 TsaB [Vicinamibacterales bacterium]|nr:tRNA (adenosine(37)-N6)-threonylcarbamoyltransferase complex dimerization subunit type 1 TsaB [Vicinamibacterales bacterium]
MLILSLDTTTPAGSAAVLRDGQLLVERAGDPARTHGARLPHELIAVLEAAGARLADVDRLAVASGPGSFTGLRVGIATMQALALARGRQVVPVPALEALAWPLRHGSSLVAPWMDARRGEVFAALYDPETRALLHGPSALSPERTLDAWRDEPSIPHAARITFVGDGALRYRGLLERRLGDGAAIVPEVPLLAGAIAEIAYAMADRAVNPHAIVPLYVRRPDAELARERRR